MPAAPLQAPDFSRQRQVGPLGCARVALEYGWAGLVVGLLVFLFPGFAWAFALGRGLDTPRRIGLGIVLAFTLAPAVTFVANLVFGLPIRLATVVMVSVAVGVAGVAVLAARALSARLTPS